MSNIERRVHTGAVGLRGATGQTGESGACISGYAAVFDSETTIGDMFRERIASTAFDLAINRDDVRALFNHDANLPLGRTSAKTLTLSTDRVGLKYSIILPATSYAADLKISIQRGDVSQSSFAFSADEDTWTKPIRAALLPLRTIVKATLFDVSPVTFAAYASTTVSARSRELAERAIGRAFVSLSTARARFELAVVEIEL